jgi:polygalacturonase
MSFSDIEYVTFTSSHQGMIDGNGLNWWGYIEYLEIAENRPRLLHVTNAGHLLIENLFFKNSPYWTTYFDDVEELEIRHCVIDARIDNATNHNIVDISAFNTDGFDVAGKNIWIHDCTIWNDDDCIAVKDQSSSSTRSKCSENMLFENINASGVGLTIGSIGASCVRNITFRNSIMPNTFKGLYLKSRPHTGTSEISNILYENITITNPSQW